MERFKQGVLPVDDFAEIAVDSHLNSVEGVDDVLADTLRESGRILATEREGHHPRQLDNVRGFLTAMIGFPTDIQQDNIRKMNRPTRSGKR